MGPNCCTVLWGNVLQVSGVWLIHLPKKIFLYMFSVKIILKCYPVMLVMSDVLQHRYDVGKDLSAAVLLGSTLRFGSFLFPCIVPELHFSVIVLGKVLIKPKMVFRQ